MRRELRKALPPGPRAPAALQLLGAWKRPTATLEGLRRYGKRVTVQMPFQPPLVILSDPSDVKELFTAPPDLVHPGEGARILAPIVGHNSVILLDEGVHMEQRRLMLPAFHGDRMRTLLGLMTEIADAEVEGWPREQAVALHPRLQRLTLEIILRAVFGLERGARLDRLRDLLSAVLAFGESPLSVLPAVQRFARWSATQRRFAAQMERVDELIFDLIAERRAGAAARNGSSGGDDVLGALLAARHAPDAASTTGSDQAGSQAGSSPEGQPMSPQEIRDELMTALVAGHETTASQLAWAFERLAREPRVVACLISELEAGDNEEYLTATINEILRLRPVLPNAEPRLTMAPIEIGGFHYPAGVLLLASAYLIHHDPGIYERPSAFEPERFLASPPGTYTWIPFGGGRRRCLGASFAVQEMKIVLRAVLSRYSLSGTGRPETTRRRSITFSPAGEATVMLHERSQAARPAALAHA